MSDDFGQVVRSLFASAAGSYQEACWQPSVDIYRGESGWLVKFDLAGVKPEDVQLTLSGSLLTVSGVRRDWTIIQGQRAYSLEIAYNRFQRTVELPCHLENAQTCSEFRDGMYLITIVPRSRES
jgi:HSP20 family protein